MERRENVIRWLKTTVVMLAMTNSGMNLGLFSPTFPDMEIITSSSTSQMSTTLTWTGISSMIGAIVLGPMFDRFNGFMMLTIALLLQGVAIGLAPWCPDLSGYQLLASMSCLFNFGIMAGSISVNCYIWREHPAMLSPIVQATDLVHAFGTAITPQIVVPFIGQRHHSANSTVPSTGNLTTPSLHYNTSTTTDEPRKFVVHPVQIAYVLIAGIDIAVAALCLFTYVLDRRNSAWKAYEYKKSPMVRSRSYSLNEDELRLIAEEEEEQTTSLTTEMRQRANSLRRDVLQKKFSDRVAERRAERARALRECNSLDRPITRLRGATKIEISEGHDPIDQSVPRLACEKRLVSLVIVIFLFFMVNGGRDALLSGLLFMYVNQFLGWSASAGTLLVTFYHITRVVVHIAVVFLARCISPTALTVINMIILIATSGGMLATVYAGKVFTGIAIIATGFATSNLHPTAITLAQRSFVVNGKVIGLFLSGVACGQISFSPIAGLLLQKSGAYTFPALLLGISLAGTVLFFLWTLLTRLAKYCPRLCCLPSQSPDERKPLITR